MARAKRHYILNLIWHIPDKQRKKRSNGAITQRCHKREFLLKFKQDRHCWIQWLFEAKRRFGLVVLNYESFVSTHRKWVQATLEEIDAKRESRWTESIAVGGRPFIEGIIRAMGAMAKGRCIQTGEGALELREAQSTYNAIFEAENRDTGPQ